MRSRVLPLMSTMNRCERVPSSQVVQWRNRSWSATCALTLLSAAAFSRDALQASGGQSGYTDDVKATRSFVGAKAGPVAPPLRCVSCFALPPSVSDTHSCPPAMYAMCFPSGDQRASVAAAPAVGNERGVAPNDEMMNVVGVLRLLATSVVRTVYRI